MAKEKVGNYEAISRFIMSINFQVDKMFKGKTDQVMEFPEIVHVQSIYENLQLQKIAEKEEERKQSDNYVETVSSESSERAD